jgi:hypothetical protein
MWTKKFKALLALVIISGIAMIATLAVYLWAALTARAVLETSMGTAFGLASLAFSVFLGAILSTSSSSEPCYSRLDY